MTFGDLAVAQAVDPIEDHDPCGQVEHRVARRGGEVVVVEDGDEDALGKGGGHGEFLCRDYMHAIGILSNYSRILTKSVNPHPALTCCLALLKDLSVSGQHDWHDLDRPLCWPAMTETLTTGTVMRPMHEDPPGLFVIAPRRRCLA